MNRYELIEALQNRPFKPIRLYVSNGATYLVRHPEIVLVTPFSAIIGAPEGDNPGPAVERFHLVDLGHITRLEHVETPAGA